MKAKRPGEIIHMTFITTSTIRDGKVVVLISVDNYSKFCFGVAVEKDMPIEKVHKHIESILKNVNEKHPAVKPLFIMAYGKEMLHELENKFTGKATFLFNPVLADEIAMPEAKLFMEQLFNKK
jgi:hypothetical protein